MPIILSGLCESCLNFLQINNHLICADKGRGLDYISVFVTSRLVGFTKNPDLENLFLIAIQLYRIRQNFRGEKLLRFSRFFTQPRMFYNE